MTDLVLFPELYMVSRAPPGEVRENRSGVSQSINPGVTQSKAGYGTKIKPKQTFHL